MKIAHKLRELATSIPQEEQVMLPDLPPLQWIDGPAKNPDTRFRDCCLSEILYFIADMYEE